MSVTSLRERTQNLSDALSSDFCPWANRYVYWLKNPFWVLLLAISGSIVCGVFLNPLVLVLTAVMSAIAGAGIALPWIAVRGISCRIVFDVARSRVGQPTIVRLSVTNRLPIPVWGLSLINGFSSDNSLSGSEGVSLARVSGWSTVEYSWPFEPVRRGLYPNSIAKVETGFPFGLYRARTPVETDGQLVVWPRTVALEGMPDSTESRQTEERFSDHRTGDFGDMMGTRSFRPGDSLRRVHWAQTARQQVMIVTERQAPAMTFARVIVDLSEDSHPEPDRESTAELVIASAASICESLYLQHARVELVLGDQRLISNGTAGFQRLMDALAIADLFADETSSLSDSGFQLLITTDAGSRPGMGHQMIVGKSTSKGWLNVADDEALFCELPKLWRSACHGT